MSDSSPILIIDRGDLPSLAAAALEPEPERVILWHQLESDEAAGKRKRICEVKAEQMGVRRLLQSPSITLGLPDMPPPKELYQTTLLIQAATLAQQLNCSRIIWPRQVGPDFERMGELVDRANLVADLAGSGNPEKCPAVDLPLVDLTDEHLVDVLEETGCPLDLFWPCQTGAKQPCGTCPGCTRWSKAFMAMGVAWPWAAMASA